MGILVILFGLIVVAASAVNFGTAIDDNSAQMAQLLDVICFISGIVCVILGVVVTRLFKAQDKPAEALQAPKEKEKPAEAPAEVAAPAIAPSTETAAEAEKAAEVAVVQLLGLLQAKGRFIDFLMDDVTAYSDQQVGAAARVVHQGCKAVIEEHLQVSPVENGPENRSVTLEPGFEKDDYRLVGKVSGEPPFTGTLRHKGWRTDAVTLPRSTRKQERLPVIAPAEVEITP